MKNHLASAITLCLMIFCMLAHQAARANVTSINEVQSGTLLLKAPHLGEGHFEAAPIVDTAVDITVTGLLTRTRLKQSFKNESPHWLEAVYVFPLPDTSSVDKLKMMIGDRVIQGVIQTREQAIRTYEAAKISGRKASLLEQQRSNLFTSRVANIPPGEQIEISIEFQSQVRYQDGSFSLSFPLTITPRYIPGQRLVTNMDASEEKTYQTGNNGWASIEDADQITPPMVESYDAPATSIEVTIDSGLPLESVVSGSHEITTQQTDNIWQILLKADRIAMDRDFELVWHPAIGQSPHAAVFRENRNTDHDKDSFASIMLLPPQDLFDPDHAAREVIFVIDTSGSMQGNSIIQARKALQLGIDRLSETDTFNVFEFDDNTQALFTSAVSANRANRSRAIQWVSSLAADGGTEIMTAMDAALASQHNSTDRLRQIIFITDGSVGNENEIFKRIQKTINNSRLFTVGIGSAPNTWFMRKAAELGRGSYTSIARSNEVSTKMLQLFNKLERPVLTNITLNWSGITKPEIYPDTVPDLYAGEPVLADARWSDTINEGELVISGSQGGQPWQRRLEIDQPTATGNRSELHKRWAKRKIESLEDSLLFGSNPEEITEKITQTALDYGLVSQYTSLVAVELEVSRDPLATGLNSAEVPSAIPFGNTMSLPQGSLGIGFKALLAMLFSISAVLFSLATLQQVRNP